MKRIRFFDIAKGIAILAVILGHSAIEANLFMPHRTAQIIVSICFSFHMPLFFLISGYLYNPKGTIKEELYKDLKTLLLPYLIYQFIFYPYWFVRELIVPHQVINIHNSITVSYTHLTLPTT